MYEFEDIDLINATDEMRGYLLLMGLDVDHLLLAGIRSIALSKDFGLDLRMDYLGPLWHLSLLKTLDRPDRRVAARGS